MITVKIITFIPPAYIAKWSPLSDTITVYRWKTWIVTYTLEGHIPNSVTMEKWQSYELDHYRIMLITIMYSHFSRWKNTCLPGIHLLMHNSFINVQIQRYAFINVQILSYAFINVQIQSYAFINVQILSYAYPCFESYSMYWRSNCHKCLNGLPTLQIKLNYKEYVNIM